MYRRVNCRKYWKWKRQQESRSKKSEKKKKKRKPKETTVDCIDSVEQPVPTETVFKAPRSCQKKNKKKKKKKIRSSFGVVMKHISIAELLLKHIKPSMEIRECILNPRHIPCLRTEMTDVTPELVEDALLILNQMRKVDRMDSLEKIKLGLKPKPKDNLRKGKDICPKQKKIKDEESDSDEDSDCISICSTDSKICLAGMKLTAKDRKEIKKYQEQSQEDSKKDDD